MSSETSDLLCGSCELRVSPSDAYCPHCGIQRGFPGSVLPLVPAISTGLVVATVGALLGQVIPLSMGDGMVRDFSQLILGTTVPYFDIVFAFVGSWAAVVALTGRGPAKALLVGLGVALLYCGTIAGTQILHEQPHDFQRLGATAALAPIGAVASLYLHHPLGQFTKLSTLRNSLPGGRYVGILATTFVAVAGALLLYALVVAAVIIALCVLAFYVTLKIIGAFLGGGSDRQQLYIPKGGRIADDGRVMEPGLLFDSPTGQRVDEDGYVVNEGLLGEGRTGIRVDEDGRVLKEGLLWDEQTGIRLKDDGTGRREVVREGLLLDDSTGLEISRGGQAEETGLLWNDAAGIAIDEHGVHQVHADLNDGWRSRTDENGDRRFETTGLLGGTDAGVRIDRAGQGHRDRFLGEETVPLAVGDDGLVKQRRG